MEERWKMISEEIDPSSKEKTLEEKIVAAAKKRGYDKRVPGMVQIAPGKWRSRSTPW